MTDRNEQLHTLKTIAKRLARAGRIAHHEALDLVARHLTHPHWNALMGGWEKGWRPTAAQMDAVENAPIPTKQKPADNDMYAAQHIHEEPGEIDGHPYELTSNIMGVYIHGRGWGIFVDAAPSIEPTIERDKRLKDNPVDDVEFVLMALRIAEVEAERVRAKIATDWPRRSTKSDANGRVVHPLWSGRPESNEWFCLHCDGKFSGASMAANMWHCPSCSATPIDIFPAPFWRGAA
jgi:hypothetical protein